MYAGTLPISTDISSSSTDEGGLMFWLYEPNECAVEDSMVLWLNGGPGCSSFGGMLFENAPITIPHRPAGFFGMKENEPLVFNEYSWTRTTTMLYVEQPAGTGFSFGVPPENESEVARDMYGFLQHFYSVFDHLQPKRLFIFGESYAGMYVPSIAHKIHQEKKNRLKPSPNPSKNIAINLAGIALGNGWIDALVQGPVVIDFAWWHGMIDTRTRDALKDTWDLCKASADSISTPATSSLLTEPFHEFTVPDECGILGATMAASGAGIFSDMVPNAYDVTTWDTYPMIYGKNGTFAAFFNNEEVQKILHAPRDTWRLCIPGEGRRRRLQQREKLLLDDDVPISMLPYMAELLDEAEIRVVVYNGDRDLTTCSQGSEILLDSMQWSGQADWLDPHKTRRGLWMVNGQVAGYSRPSGKGLDFVVVRNSGHLVPMNQPQNALDLVTRVLSGKGFSDVELPVFVSPKSTEKIAATAAEAGAASSIGSSMESCPGRPHLAVLVATACGFILGLASVYFHTVYQSKKQVQYEALGDVEVESP